MGALHVAINAQLVQGHAGGVEQNIVGLINSLMDAVGLEDLITLIGPPRGKDGWLRRLVHGRARVVIRNVIPPRPAIRGLRSGLRFLHWLYQKVSGARLRNLLKRRKIDVVHFPYQTWCPTEAPFIFEPWDLQHLYLPEFFSPQEIERRNQVYRGGCEKAALVVTATAWTKHDLVRQYGIRPEKIAVIRRGAFAGQVERPSRDMAERLLGPYRLPKNFLFFPAKDFPHKNHLRLFEALAKVRRRGLDIHLVCCGRVLDSNKAPWRRCFEEHGLTGKVHLLGRVDDAVVAALYLQATALAFPSLFEGLGIPILEAFENDLPVVTTRASCIPEVAGDAAVYADGYSADSLADAIATICTDSKTRERCRQRGRELLRDFDWRQTGRQFLACYRSVSGIGVTPEDEHLFRQLTGSENKLSSAAA